jgi:sialate O-acetylesterase
MISMDAHGQVQLPHLFSDHAVLQRQQPIHIWGWDKPQEKVTLTFHAQTTTAVTDATGSWSAWLKPEEAGGPFQLTVTGSSTVTISDLLVGDVWLASGQSNMQMPLQGNNATSPVLHGKEAIASATLQQVRLLKVDMQLSDVPQSDFKATWTTTTPETAAPFSAVAYFFGKELNEREHVPIGLIQSTWGGTPIESWISLDGLAQDYSLMPVFSTRAAFAKEQQAMEHLAAEEKIQDEEALRTHQPVPVRPWAPNEGARVPASIYNGMIAPEVGYSLKGVIWYQGESNASPERASLYAKLMPALIADWRTKWQQDNFPFLFVQLSSYGPGESWGIVRDAQRQTLSVANTGMAVALDVGDEHNIHPADKLPVGARLALAARAIAYGEPVEFSGPLFRQATTQEHSMRVWFDHAKGLHAKGAALAGFEVAGADGIFSPATATIEGESVVVQSSSVPTPSHVRYGWAGYTPANLYNGADLPAPAFGSE